MHENRKNVAKVSKPAQLVSPRNIFVQLEISFPWTRKKTREVAERREIGKRKHVDRLELWKRKQKRLEAKHASAWKCEHFAATRHKYLNYVCAQHKHDSWNSLGFCVIGTSVCRVIIIYFDAHLTRPTMTRRSSWFGFNFSGSSVNCSIHERRHRMTLI